MLSTAVATSSSVLPPLRHSRRLLTTCSGVRSHAGYEEEFNGNWNTRREFLLMMTTATVVATPLLLLPTPQNSHASSSIIDDDQISTIRFELRKVMSKGKAAPILRLAFHDAGTFSLNDETGGMNGSILYELDRPENTGLNKPVKVLKKAKTELDKVLQVSWADMIALAGSEAVSLCGGPLIPVQVGRIDARLPDPEGRLPLETLDASGLKKCFMEKGLSTQELVALSGAHTIGSKGFGSPIVFDNSYYKILLEKPWTSPGAMSAMIGLPSDRALVEDTECLRWINTYAGDQVKFFDDFASAYTKLVNSGASWRPRDT